MKKAKYIVSVLLVGLIALAAYLGFRYYPVWRAAKFLEENLDTAHFSYEMEAELAQEEVEQEQGRLLQILANVTGFDKAALCRPAVRGEVWDGTIHATIFPGNAESSLFEIYLSDDTDVINETMLYNVIQRHLTGQYPLLSGIMPRQQESMYMTLGQVEQIFGLDLGKLRDFRLDPIAGEPGAGKYFFLLAAMSREEKDGKTLFTLEEDRLELRFEIPKEDDASSLKISLYVWDPAGLYEENGEIASLLGLEAGEGLAMVKSFSVTLTPQEEAIAMPANFVSQGVVDLISQIREWVTNFMGGGEDTGEGAV